MLRRGKVRFILDGRILNYRGSDGGRGRGDGLLIPNEGWFLRFSLLLLLDLLGLVLLLLLLLTLVLLLLLLLLLPEELLLLAIILLLLVTPMLLRLHGSKRMMHGRIDRRGGRHHLHRSAGVSGVHVRPVGQGKRHHRLGRHGSRFLAGCWFSLGRLQGGNHG